MTWFNCRDNLFCRICNHAMSGDWWQSVTWVGKYLNVAPFPVWLHNCQAQGPSPITIFFFHSNKINNNFLMMRLISIVNYQIFWNLTAVELYSSDSLTNYYSTCVYFATIQFYRFCLSQCSPNLINWFSLKVSCCQNHQNWLEVRNQSLTMTSPVHLPTSVPDSSA